MFVATGAGTSDGAVLAAVDTAENREHTTSSKYGVTSLTW